MSDDDGTKSGDTGPHRDSTRRTLETSNPPSDSDYRSRAYHHDDEDSDHHEEEEEDVRRRRQEEELEEQEWAVERTAFRERLAESHFPFVDQLLYEKYLLRPRSDFPASEQRRQAAIVQAALARHRVATVEVLRAIEGREVTLASIAKLVDEVTQAEATGEAAARSAILVDLQAQALRALYLLRQQTQAVVEAIVAWRSNLNRPFPFLYGGEGRNYLLKILADSHQLQHSVLGSLLPLRMDEHPLLSDVPALNLFGGRSSSSADGHRASSPSTSSCGGGGAAARQSGSSATTGGRRRTTRGSATLPSPAAGGGSSSTSILLRNVGRSSAPPLAPELQQRLVAAERYLRGELDAQLALFRDLLQLCAQGCFVPVLAVPAVIPRGVDGVRLLSAEWLDKLKHSLTASLQGMLDLPSAFIAGSGEK